VLPTYYTKHTKMLGTKKLGSDVEVQSAIRQWLGQQPASFFALGVQKLVGWHKGKIFEFGQYVVKIICLFK